MEVIARQQFLDSKARYFRKILDGAVFIYPTDTIYGIGCDATNSAAVDRVRSAKKRDAKPFSVAVPSKEWIRSNCVITGSAEAWLKKLPGPYTLLLELKNKDAVAEAVHPNTEILGIRMPKNWLAAEMQELGIPLVSTSANITKKKHMTSLRDLDESVASAVDFIIYEGEKAASPSTIIRFSSGKAEIIRR